MQSSLAVVAESQRSVLVLPSMNVMGSIRGFFDFVACMDHDEIQIRLTKCPELHVHVIAITRLRVVKLALFGIGRILNAR